jgi:hypothetical protein
MLLKKLFNDITTINEALRRGDLTLQDVTIQSTDNYYLISKDSCYIKIEKEYNLVGMWSLIEEDEITYKIRSTVNGVIQLDDGFNIKLTYEFIKPILRELKLNKIGI